MEWVLAGLQAYFTDKLTAIAFEQPPCQSVPLSCHRQARRGRGRSPEFAAIYYQFPREGKFAMEKMSGFKIHAWMSHHHTGREKTTVQ